METPPHCKAFHASTRATKAAVSAPSTEHWEAPGER